MKLRLESITGGGEAVGRFEGIPVFVEGGAPDETVLCRVTEDRKKWMRSELLEIIEPSPARVDSLCAFNNKCGGCPLQHIEYNTQLEAKKNILKDSLLKFGGIPASEMPAIDPEVYPSPEWEYRNRMQFHCIRQAPAGSPKYGLMGRRSPEIIRVSDCPVASIQIRDILRVKEKELTPPPGKDRFTVFAKDNVILSEGGQERGKIKLLEKDVLIDAGLFFQSNCFMLEKLIIELRKIAKQADCNYPMADLYCGVGTFAIFLCDLFPKIILAEENKDAKNLARENLKGANAEFFALCDTQWPRTILRNKAAIGFAVVDPPRSGLNSNTASALANNGPPVIAYVSCNTVSLARDSKILARGGYKLKELKLFDFYPQTAHIESLAVFVK
ncbi:MAG: TRAM domain-containing protein [Treponema sp.]|nr:TRAM domain-containing protein [Treponema sp.]